MSHFFCSLRSIPATMACWFLVFLLGCVGFVAGQTKRHWVDGNWAQWAAARQHVVDRGTALTKAR